MTERKLRACAAGIAAVAAVTARNARRLRCDLLELNGYFAFAASSDLIVGGGDVVAGEELRGEEWLEFVFVGECGDGFEDFSVVGAVVAGQEWKQGEDSGVGGSAEGEWR